VNPVSRTVSFLLYSNLFIAICAFALTLQPGLPDPSPVIYWIAGFNFFATLLEYNVHRMVALIRSVELPAEPRHTWLEKHRLLFYSMFFLSAIGLLLTGIQLPSATYPWIGISALITILYSFPLIPTMKGMKRLRAIPHMKVVTIAVGWTLSTYYVPLSVTGGSNIIEAIVRFLFVFAITIPFDARDIHADQRRGLKTIPLVFGVKTSYSIAIGFLLIASFLCLFQLNAGTIATIIVSLFTMIFILKEGWRSHPFYYYGLLDGTLLLIPVLHLVLSKYFI
jgi:hypothetical protein